MVVEIGVRGGKDTPTMDVMLLAEADITLGSLHTEDGEATSAISPVVLTVDVGSSFLKGWNRMVAGGSLTRGGTGSPGSRGKSGGGKVVSEVSPM